MDEQPRILFLDDEPNVLDALRRVLRHQAGAWDMVFESSVESALERQRQRPFQVAVVDVHMPVMSGLELIRALNAIDAGTLSIILTGATDIATAAAAINEASVFRFYTKPCGTDALVTGITQALAEGARRRASSAPAAAGATLSMAAMDRLPTGIIVVDEQARLLFANRSGAALLAAKDGLAIGADGMCRAGRPAETAELHGLIKAALATGAIARALSVGREMADRPLSLVIAPLLQAAGNEPAVVLLVGDPDQRGLPSVEMVSRLFDLTVAEARLALALTEGHRIEDAAEMLGITQSSARTYLKRIFSKTDVTRQAELVRLILAAPTLSELGPKAGDLPPPHHAQQ
jgi:DNA-binding NarL/FixJ family response regulator